MDPTHQPGQLPFSERVAVYEFLPLPTLINTISKLSKREASNLDQTLKHKQTLTIFIDDSSLSFSTLRRALSLCSNVDLRVQNFEQRHCFVLGTVITLCRDLQKRIELNIWVDKDLDCQLFLQACQPQFSHSLFDLVYYRVDQRGFSHKLKDLMEAFFRIETVQFQEIESSSQYIDPSEIPESATCTSLKYVSMNEKKVSDLVQRFPAARKIVLRLQNFQGTKEIDVSCCPKLESLKIAFPNTRSLIPLEELSINLGVEQTNVRLSLKMTKATVDLQQFFTRINQGSFTQIEGEFGQVECDPDLSLAILQNVYKETEDRALEPVLLAEKKDGKLASSAYEFLGYQLMGQLMGLKTFLKSKRKTLVFAQKLGGEEGSGGDGPGDSSGSLSGAYRSSASEIKHLERAGYRVVRLSVSHLKLNI